jgi:hypothetical protein
MLSRCVIQMLLLCYICNTFVVEGRTWPVCLSLDASGIC